MIIAPRPLRPNGHTWDDLGQTEELSKEEVMIDAIFYRVFTSPDGVKALENMHLLTTWKRNKPNDSDGALREAEAQRRLVAVIEARIARYAKGSNGGRGTNSGRSRQRRRAGGDSA